MRKFHIAAVGVSFLALAGIAWAQLAPPVSVVASIGPTDLIPIVPAGVPTSAQKFANPAQITAQVGYYKSAPATAFTYTFANNVSVAMFRPSTTLAAGTITMPAGPSDGQVACAYSKQIVTTLTWNANTGQTLNDAITAFTAAGHACYVYSASNATWDRAE